MKFLTVSVFVCLVLGGCSVLPRQGPMAGDIIALAADDPINRPYEIFDISPNVVSAVQHRRPGSLATRFGDARRGAEPTISVGDTVLVNIWEAPGGILFASSNMVWRRSLRNACSLAK